MLGRLFGKKKSAAPTATTTAAASPQVKLDLMKSRAEIVTKLCLSKGFSEDQKSRVAIALDFSGSMSSEYSSGRVQELVERLIPIAMRFDDNAAIDVFIFHTRAFDLGEVTLANFEGFVQTKIMDQYSMGGTNYAPIIDMITKKYSSEKGDPGYVMFIADGNCWDEKETKQSVIKASKEGIFWQFIGIGSDKFKLFEELDDMEGRVIDNANFFQVKDVKAMSDKELYSKMMDEYPDYLKEAKTKGII